MKSDLIKLSNNVIIRKEHFGGILFNRDTGDVIEVPPLAGGSGPCSYLQVTSDRSTSGSYQVEDIIKDMALEEKIGQMFMLDFSISRGHFSCVYLIMAVFGCIIVVEVISWRNC